MTQPNPKSDSGMQSTDYTLEPDTLVWWTTPILNRQLPDSQAINKELKEIVLSRAATKITAKKSDDSGWNSDDDFLTWDGPAIAQLQAWIVAAFQDVTKVTASGQVYGGKIMLKAWANLSRRGDYSLVRTHPSSVWSGVYCIDAGDPPTTDRPNSGMIELLDPRAGAEMTVVPGQPFGRAKLIQPQAGQITVFPSWLKHTVHPYWGEGDRIMIVFNIGIASIP
ncbi:MAG: hypothetical protein GKS03_04210 [Alphaproteobacteria bacterium]|nr:hypothetical protein [Alphaproteobacteria bacterium]